MERASSSQTTSSPREPESVFIANTPSNVQVIDLRNVEEKDRTVNRRLRSIHVFMITISGVLGAGLYVNSGSILRIGGPSAVLISFTVLGLLAWSVMQCLGEMLALWPISGALIEFVGTFVDEDLGTTVGAAYWFAYSINFAALIIAAAEEMNYWNPGKAIEGTIMFFLIPTFLVLFNSFGVHLYGLTEVVGGSLKLLGVLVVIVSMILINVGVGSGKNLGTTYYKHGPMFPHEREIADNWVTALFISFSIAAFAYVGVEITAATAMEARIDHQNQDDEHTGSLQQDRKATPADLVSVRFSSTWISFIAWLLYFVSGFLLTLNIQWNDIRLPRISWASTKGTATAQSTGPSNPDSGFVVSAYLSKVPGLANMFTIVLMITALTAANTNLYVASRTLFGLTRKIDGARWKWLGFFGRTNRYQVPVRAMFISCFFIWVPFLYLSESTTITTLLEILSQIGSVSCLIVWSCECWAYIRFYNCMYRHRDELREKPQYQHVCRFRRDGPVDTYPWRSHGQPLTMYAALFGCLFILVVCNGAVLWNGFHYKAFLAEYFAPLAFLALWLFLKIYRSGGWRYVNWRLEDLSNINVVQDKIDRLDDIRHRATARDTYQEQPGWGNLWGLF
ncbi:hypothetical protein ASPZODRAFT_67618 [Penicilliopsis zonata CBS 506.65]|uniref:Amino acid permease/ SLC12A domain-containing protein n=1 Tax=Penicilliopsis zonata CBS 506.65 TaxID=1073090 RepID=A0A1L9SFN3_9EURO|nr:hypothetical protein ASPZODRAFT_67618 [Penicilliopsis zonata CBS 506.65]OJJ46050.1 hypothetical protein ASPZODRAFT_67618 [Penicilliopsis zonata CBS 506.65]